MMTYEKWLKIEALMKNPASTPNEKAICKKILADNPKPPKPKPKPDPRFVHPGVHRPTPRTPESGDFWRDAARRQAQAVNDGIKWNQQTRRPYSQAAEEADERAQNFADGARAQRQAYEDAENVRRYGGRKPKPGDYQTARRKQESQARWDFYKETLEAGNLDSLNLPIFDTSMFGPPQSDQKKKKFIDELARLFNMGKKGKK